MVFNKRSFFEKKKKKKKKRNKSIGKPKDLRKARKSYGLLNEILLVKLVLSK